MIEEKMCYYDRWQRYCEMPDNRVQSWKKKCVIYFKNASFFLTVFVI